MRTNVSAAVCETITNLPFGDGQTTTGSCGDPSPLHFTGKQRDTETGNDDFGARYFNSSMARWLTPDWSARPAGVLYADLLLPQTLNLYAYVGNNPVTHTDPDGHGDPSSPDAAPGNEYPKESANCPGRESCTKTPNQNVQDSANETAEQDKAQKQTVTTMTSSQTTAVNRDGSKTFTITTTTATFSTANGHEGEFVGATSKTRTVQVSANGNRVMKDTTTGPLWNVQL